MHDQTAYKILTSAQFLALQQHRFNGAPADLADGYIHLSTAAQLPGTLARHFTGQADLLIAAINLRALGPALRWEAARDGALFPHVYAKLKLGSVTHYNHLAYHADGRIILPGAPIPVAPVPELCAMPARRLAALVAGGAVSAAEVMAAYLGHIDALNPYFNAIVSRRPTAALFAQAAEADAARRRGDRLGPLHGLPMAVKDTADTAGITTTYGSPLFRGHIPDTDGLMVARLRAAGAIFIGKTNIPEFALGSHSFNPVFGVTANAWDPGRSAGGSSGGAAVAIALRMLPFADGSDFGGSLRNPAAYNNILGFRPSQGRIPHWPRGEAFLDQLATEGPMARSADDLALLFAVQAGYDERAPLSLCGNIPDWHDALGADLSGQSIGWLGDLGGHLPFEPGILPLCEASLAPLAAAGLRVEPIAPAIDWEAMWRAFIVLRQASMLPRFAAAYDDPARRTLLKPELCWEIEQGRGLALADLQAALAARTAWYDAALKLFARHDYLALPTAQVFPFPQAQSWPAEIAGRRMPSYHRWMEVVIPATLLGCPVINLPAGFSDTGLPMGLQIIGRPRADLSVLRLAHLHETLTPFLRATPPAITPRD